MNKKTKDDFLIYKSGKTITNEQADSILWKTFKFHTLGSNFLGWVANCYGNALLVKNANGDIWSESNRPLTPIDYDDNFFYCAYDQGADDYKKPPNEYLRKELFFTPKIINGIPNKDSYVYTNRIIAIDKWFLYNAINKECDAYKNTPYTNIIEQILVLDRLCYTIINHKINFDVQTIAIYKKVWNQKTMSFEIVDNLIKDLRKININNPNDRDIQICNVNVFSRSKSSIVPPEKSIVLNLDKDNIERVFYSSNESNLLVNKLTQKYLNLLYNKIDFATKNMNLNEKENWINNLNCYTDNIINKYNKQLKKFESGKYPKNWDAVMLSSKISETKSTISKLEKNLLDNERINKLKNLFFTTYDKKNKNTKAKENSSNNIKDNEKER